MPSPEGEGSLRGEKPRASPERGQGMARDSSWHCGGQALPWAGYSGQKEMKEQRD